jgi:hypothetical protein
MTSFQAEPPTITIRGKQTKLRPFGRGAGRILAQLSNVEDANEKGGAFVVAFAAIYSLPPAEAFDAVNDESRFNREVGIADMELSSEDLNAVAEYIAGINQRTEASSVTVDDSPGKP